MQNPILFSGIQPSGALGIGHYLGVMRHWQALCVSHTCLYSVVDLHAITVKQSPDALQKNTFDLLAWYLACGFDPMAQTLFVQSHVSEHAELCWLLSTITGMGELGRMTQYKDKSQQHAQNINVGLFTYPVLMAADILLYGTNIVPVGDDQKQHLELARDIAARFNKQYDAIFTIPEPLIAKTAARIMSLQDPMKKMSKSDPNQNSTIFLHDTPKQITTKIKRAVTDSVAHIAYDPARPGISNLITLMHSVTGEDFATIEQRYAGQGYGVFKADLAEQLVEMLTPIQNSFTEYRSDEQALLDIMQIGAERARAHAAKHMKRIKQAMGFVVI